MEQFVTNALNTLAAVPLVITLVLVAVWVGLESAGIGVPIEPVMLFLGSLAAKEHAVAIAVVGTFCAAAGCIAFSSLAYYIGQRLGTIAITRVGRYVGLTEARAEHIELWLRRRGTLGVFIARETPMVRTYGSFVMGAAGVPKRKFLIGTALGALLYCGIFIALGTLLGNNYKAALDWMQKHFGTRDILMVWGIIILLFVAHHFWGRLSLRRLASHFRRHTLAKETVAASSSTPAHPAE